MYADYDFYLNVYFGNAISTEDFQRLSERASDYIRSATQGISDTVEGDALTAVKKCTCAIADVLLDESVMAGSIFSGGQPVASEAVGSWSRSFKAPSLSAVDVDYIGRRKRDALALYLGNIAAFAPLFRVRSYPCIHRAK